MAKRWPAAVWRILIVLLVMDAAPGRGWTPRSQVVIATEAARLAPPDLRRQIERHWSAYQEGVLAPFEDGDPAWHYDNPDGSGLLEEVLRGEVDRAVRDIVSHRPFRDIVRQMGVVTHYVADANNPLNTSAQDPREPRYFADYLRYMESAGPRFQLVFYGLEPEVERQGSIAPLVAEALRRGRGYYPLIGREYRRIGAVAGSERFDDRSTAFGIASLAFSHAVTDAAVALRHIWLEAGGADPRRLPERGGRRLLSLPRATR